MRKNILLTFFSAILIGISVYPYNLGFLSWFGFIPFIFVLVRVSTYKRIILLTFLWGICYHAISVFWLSMNVGTTPVVAWISMFASTLILTMNTIFIGVVWYRLQKSFIKYRYILFPLVWVTIEYIRSYGFLGFPWVSIANSQIDYLILIQNVEITGIYGISFWIITLNVLLYKIIFIKRDKYSIILFTFTFILPWLSGKMLFDRSLEYINTDSEYITAIIYQPNIKQSDKDNKNLCEKEVNELIYLSKSSNENADLIIWPETTPYYGIDFKNKSKEININDLGYSHYWNKFIPISNQSLLFGCEIKQNGKFYNSSILLDSNGNLEYYHKQQLVPLVEFFPFANKIPFINAAFSKGTNDKIFTVKDINFIGLVCFESTFPEINRRPINSDKGVDAIIYVVNDGWYESEPEPSQHARQTIFRAIENRRPVLRCANRGISMYINERGEIEQELELNTKGEINNIRIYEKNNKTFYTRFGNVFAFSLLIINIGLFISTFVRNEKNK